MFGQPIKLTFKGNEVYKSLLGAWTSFAILLILLAYGIYTAIVVAYK